MYKTNGNHEKPKRYVTDFSKRKNFNELGTSYILKKTMVLKKININYLEIAHYI